MGRSEAMARRPRGEQVGAAVVASVDIDLGDVEFNAVKAVVATGVCLLADEVRGGVCASGGVLALPPVDAGPGGFSGDVAVDDSDVGESAQGLQVRGAGA